MRTAHFYLKLSPEELLEYYQGYKKYVRVRTYQGYSLQFRADHLRQWVKPYGINGEFEIHFDQHNKFAGLFLYKEFGQAAPVTKQPSSHSSTGSSASSGPNQRPRGFKTSI